ncbi:MAG: cupredoxin family copper-binding protein [Candidatus Acidiferrum sp.]
MMRKKQVWIRGMIFALCSGVLLAGAGKLASPATKNANATTEVKIDNFTFAPVTLTVGAGTTVKWTNRDDIPHTVVSEDKSTFKSKALDTDDSFSYTFTKPGTYTYFCSIHPKMTAKVVVQ